MTTLNTKVGGVWTAIAGDVQVQNPINDFISLWTPGPWIYPTLTNGWVNLAPYQPVSYRKRGDIIEMRGIMNAGTLNVTVFTLPVGYRPPVSLIFSELSNGANDGVWIVNLDGNCVPQVGQVGGWFSVNCNFSITA
jgi:hypothetical protein